ncbi:hypothetical protein COOONC_12504 [Cooperia oncophora]
MVFFRRELLEWCDINETVKIDGDRVAIGQESNCSLYEPKKEDSIRVYLSCDPQFAQPTVVIFLGQPMSKKSYFPFALAFACGWSLSLIMTSTILSFRISICLRMEFIANNDINVLLRNKLLASTTKGMKIELENGKFFKTSATQGVFERLP